MEIYAKIYAKSSKELVLECCNDRKKNCYPSGEWKDANGGNHFSIGCTVVGGKHIAISLEALWLIKYIDQKAMHTTSDLGDISAYLSQDNDVVLSWVGENKRVINIQNLNNFEIGEGETRFDVSALKKAHLMPNEQVKNLVLGKTYIKGVEY